MHQADSPKITLHLLGSANCDCDIAMGTCILLISQSIGGSQYYCTITTLGSVAHRNWPWIENPKHFIMCHDQPWTPPYTRLRVFLGLPAGLGWKMNLFRLGHAKILPMNLVWYCRILAYPYGALVLGPPNFGGLGPKGLIPFTKFRASRVDMYGTLTHRILPFWVHVWSQIHQKSEVWPILWARFTQIFETFQKDAFWSIKEPAWV
jgi:hypothetical protein